jgi:type I restriction enzyme, S subunit
MNAKWPEVPLGEVLTHRKEFVRIDDTQEYLRCRVQLHAKGVVLRDRIEGGLIKTKEQQECRAGEFLVAEIDAKVGGFGIVPPDLDGAIVSSHYFLFAVNAERLDNRFLDYYSKTPVFRDQVRAQGSTNYAAIRPQHVLAYTIPLPPLPEQRRIVAKIERLAAKIEEARGLRHRSFAEAGFLLQAGRREVFADCGSFPRVHLEEVCDEIVDCLHSNPLYSETGVPTIRSPDVGWGSLLLEQARRTSEEEYRRRTARGEPQPGDIVLVREGGGTGKAAIVEEGQRLSLGQRVMQLRPNRRNVLARFLLHQWLSPSVQEDQIADWIKGSASPHLNIGQLKRFSFILPPLDEQRRVVAQLDALQAKVERLKALQTRDAAELNALLPAVLDRAFRGEL